VQFKYSDASQWLCVPSLWFPATECGGAWMGIDFASDENIVQETEPPSQSDRPFNPLHHGTLLSVLCVLAPIPLR